ncbi:MAG TPA: hypothetical protein VED46_01380 [Alphaproteobacteria bacterium]|nr:hypothetical protein [Alphaproteobacteria bacterium]
MIRVSRKGASLILAASLALVMTVMPGQLNLTSASIDASTAHAGPGTGGRGGPDGIGQDGPGSGASAAGRSLGHAAAAASGNDTAYAATNPETQGLTKAQEVVGTTPASETASDALNDAGSENGSETESENEEFSFSEFGSQMSADAKAAVSAISDLFTGEEE